MDVVVLSYLTLFVNLGSVKRHCYTMKLRQSLCMDKCIAVVVDLMMHVLEGCGHICIAVLVRLV